MRSPERTIILLRIQTKPAFVQQMKDILYLPGHKQGLIINLIYRNPAYTTPPLRILGKENKSGDKTNTPPEELSCDTLLKKGFINMWRYPFFIPHIYPAFHSIRVIHRSEAE